MTNNSTERLDRATLEPPPCDDTSGLAVAILAVAGKATVETDGDVSSIPPDEAFNKLVVVPGWTAVWFADDCGACVLLWEALWVTGKSFIK